MKFIGDWESKYFGIKIKNMVYYFAWNHLHCRDWGWSVEHFNGTYKRFSLYFISFQWHEDNDVKS